jgi:hypothetical protein
MLGYPALFDNADIYLPKPSWHPHLNSSTIFSGKPPSFMMSLSSGLLGLLGMELVGITFMRVGRLFVLEITAVVL